LGIFFIGFDTSEYYFRSFAIMGQEVNREVFFLDEVGNLIFETFVSHDEEAFDVKGFHDGTTESKDCCIFGECDTMLHVIGANLYFHSSCCTDIFISSTLDELEK
jgi:hypothetical protein